MRYLKRNYQKINILIFVVLIICVLSSFGQKTKNEFKRLKFKVFPDSLQNIDLQFQISSIKSNKHYKYWQCKFLQNCGFIVDENGKQVQKGELVYLRGDSSRYKRLADEYCTYNLFNKEDHDPISGFYIVAVKDSDKYELIDDSNIDLFVGEIDDFKEAVFVVNLHHFYPYSYAETDSTYVFKASHINGTAVLKLNKKGGLRILQWKERVEDKYHHRDIY